MTTPNDRMWLPLLVAVFAGACAQTGASPTPPDATADVGPGASAADSSANPTDSLANPVDAAATVSGFIAAPAGSCAATSNWKTVGFVYDGDTFRLNDGAEPRIRMLGINAPEMSGTGGPECGAKAAKSKLEALLAKGTPVCLVADDHADDMDKYDRLLRYVYVKQPDDAGQVQVWQVNANLVRTGLARVYYPFASGLTFEKTLVQQQDAAKAEHLGGWNDCGW